MATISESTVDVDGSISSNKKMKTDTNATSEFSAADMRRDENQVPESNGASIFKQPKVNSLLPQQNPFQMQKQQSNSNINMSIKSSQLVVPVYPDEFSTHPRYLSIMSMKVFELRKELRTMNLETGGLKKELQKRLLGALVGPETDAFPTSTDIESTKHPTPDQQDQQDSFLNDNEMDDAVETQQSENRMSFVSTHSSSDAAQMSVEVIDQRPPPSSVAALIAAKEETAMVVVSEKTIVPPVQHSFVKTTAALFSPNRITSKFQQPRPQEITLPTKSSTALSPFASIKKSLVKTAASFLSANRPDVASSVSKNEVKNVPDVPSANADTAVLATRVPAFDGIPSPEELGNVESEKGHDISNAAIPSTAVKVAVDGTKVPPLTTPFSSIVKDKQKMLADARKQRLAELRGKSKPLSSAVSSSSKSQALKSTHNKQNDAAAQTASSMSKLMPTNPREEDKRTLMTAKIREKHAALKVVTHQPFQTVTAAEAVSTKAPAVVKTVQIKPAVAPVWPPLPEKTQIYEDPPPPPANELNLRSPLDTYQISDRDESDSDESDDSGSGPKKKIPDWAQKENLIPALKKQYDDNGNRLDPDALFPEVETCDLEAIFDKKRNRFKKRTSSGNWTKDRVTVAEKLVYKRTMGFDSTS